MRVHRRDQRGRCRRGVLSQGAELQTSNLTSVCTRRAWVSRGLQGGSLRSRHTPRHPSRSRVIRGALARLEEHLRRAWLGLECRSSGESSWPIASPIREEPVRASSLSARSRPAARRKTEIVREDGIQSHVPRWFVHVGEIVSPGVGLAREIGFVLRKSAGCSGPPDRRPTLGARTIESDCEIVTGRAGCSPEPR